MKMNRSQRTLLVFLLLVSFLWSGGTATEAFAKEFKWPMFLPALTKPKKLGMGSITLRLTNDVIPHFAESASAECELRTNKLLICGLAVLHYDATEDNGQIRIRRNGSITFMPVGTCTQIECLVEPQASVEETMTYWVWTGLIWKEVAQETVSQDWDDTLRFDVQESPTGSTIGISTSTGSAYWTLSLGVIM